MRDQAFQNRCPMLMSRGHRRRSNGHRRGGIVVLLAILLPILFVLASFAINIAYVQLSRTELMVATDAAARAGGRAMSFYQSVDDAKTAAQVTAALNNVAGQPLQISFDDANNEIEFGDSETSQTSSRYVFSKIQTSLVSSGSEIANAVRVTGKFTSGSLNGPLNSLFPAMGLKNSFDLQQQAVATQLDRDIALILDRSGSMSWVTFNWPSGYNPWTSSAMNAAVDAGVLGIGGYWYYGYYYQYYYYTSGNNQTTYYQWVWENYYNLGPAPQAPWDELVDAVDVFLGVLESTDQNEKVSLATYATTATLNLNLVSDYDLIRSELDSISPYGATAIGEGLQTGLPSLLDTSFARPFATKTIVLMTDGMHNTGIDPVTVAQEIVAQYNVTIHTVTFGAGADQQLMQQVAQIGGGNHYHAETGDELIDVFEEIANNLPTLITQ